MSSWDDGWMVLPEIHPDIRLDNPARYHAAKSGHISSTISCWYFRLDVQLHVQPDMLAGYPAGLSGWKIQLDIRPDRSAGYLAAESSYVPGQIFWPDTRLEQAGYPAMISRPDIQLDMLPDTCPDTPSRCPAR